MERTTDQLINNFDEEFEHKGKTFTRVYQTVLGEDPVGVFECEDFFGQPLTIAIRVTITTIGDQAIIGTQVKASLCSAEDTFDSELGIDIVLGRIIRSMGPSNTITIGIEDYEVAEDICKDLIYSKIDKIEGYINGRNAAKSFIRSLDHEANHILKERFERFK